MTTTETEREPVMTDSEREGGPDLEREDGSEAVQTRPSGDPRVLFAARALASLALLVTAVIHIRLAFQLGVGGVPLQQGQLFLLQALLCLVIGVALLSNRDRVWLIAVVLAASGLLGILVSVYAPIQSFGPFPAIDEPQWLATKAVVALAELTVIVLWLIRRIAPGPVEPTEFDDTDPDTELVDTDRAEKGPHHTIG